MMELSAKLNLTYSFAEAFWCLKDQSLFLRRRIHWKIQKNWKLDVERNSDWPTWDFACPNLPFSIPAKIWTGFPRQVSILMKTTRNSKVTILHRRQVEAKAPEWCGRRQSGSLQFTNQPSLCLINSGLTKARSPSKPSYSCSLRDKEECGSHPIERSLCLDTREESFCISISASHG